MSKRSSLFSWFTLVLKRDLSLSFKKIATFIIPLVFFLIVITLFPLALGAENSFLSSLSPGVIWVAALLAALLAVESIFNEDYRDGTLDHFLLSGEPIFLLVLAKVLAHWLVTGAPLLLASLISTQFLFLPEGLLLPLLLSLLIGTFLLSLLGALGAALTIGSTAILSAVIVLPLSIPILILGIAVITAALNGENFFSYLYYLGALLSLGIPAIFVATTEAKFIIYE